MEKEASTRKTLRQLFLNRSYSERGLAAQMVQRRSRGKGSEKRGKRGLVYRNSDLVFKLATKDPSKSEDKIRKSFNSFESAEMSDEQDEDDVVSS